MNIDYEIVESAKTEFSELKNKRYHLDYVGKTKDKIYIHIEFQARFPTKKELQRIFAYVALLHEYTGCFVETYIICVQAIPHDQIIHQYSKDNVFKINIMSLKNIDGNKKINSIIIKKEGKMDSSMNIDELKEIVQKFCEDRQWTKFHNPKELAIGISTEAGELLQIFRFKNEIQMQGILKDQKKKKDISEELADVLYYVLLFSKYTGIDLTKALKNKMKLNEERYPVQKSFGNNKKYNE